MPEMLDELRMGLRQLRTQPSHSAVVVLTLGLALGLAAVIFSFVSFFVLRPLPVKGESTMVIARASHPEQSGTRPRLSYSDFADFTARTSSVEELVGLSMGTGALTGDGAAKRVAVAAATESLFRVWDLKMFQGRRFERGEDAPGAASVVILGHGFWKRELGANSAIVGKTLTLDGRPSTVVGILSPDIEVGRFSEIDLWAPLGQTNPSMDRARRDMTVTGRRKPGVTLEQVSAEFATIAAALAKEHPETNRDWTASAIPLRDGLYGTGTEVILALLAVGVSLVFAVACANVAGVMFARATTREREMALRVSLGARKSQITRQLLVEGAVLAFLGGVLGLALAQGGLSLMRAVAFEQFYDLVVIDGPTLIFSAVLTLASPLLFSLAPALRMAGQKLAFVLRDAGAGAGTSGRTSRSRRSLVVMQIGFATALLMISGLSVRTAVALRNFDFGFDRKDLLTLRIDLAETRYSTPAAIRTQTSRLLEALRANAPVSAIGTERPVFDAPRRLAILREGAAQDDARPVMTSAVTPGYFETLGIPLRRGREFAEGDTAESAPVAVVNEAFVAKEFGGRDPLGARIQVGGRDTPWLAIVGVVSNIANPNVEEPPAPQAYLAFDQRPERSFMVFTRTPRSGAVLASFRETLRAIDPAQPLYDAKTIEQVAWEELASNRIITGLFVALGSVALALAAVGLYGLTAFVVAQRTREIGVRMALGATAWEVVRLVVAQGSRLTATGLAFGLVLGLALGRGMSSVLFNVKPWDPPTLAATFGVLSLAAVLAHFVPARRAAKVNPIDALRHD